MAKPKAKRKRKAATKRRATKPTRTRKAKAAAKPPRKPTPKQGPASPGRAAPPKGGAQVKKKPATRTVKPSNRKPGISTQQKKSPAGGKVQPFAAAVKYRTGGIHAKPAGKGKRKPKLALSRHPDAVRARKYRRERKAIAEALEAARLEKLEKRRQRDRERRRKIIGGGAAPKKDERELAIGWLETIRDHFASFVPTSLQVVPPEAGLSTAWMAVGRYDLLEPTDYEVLGQILETIADDLLLEAAIHPQRLSQIRILFSDPNAKRGEGDSFVSKISGWQFVLGDMVGEILGGSPGDESALATRYRESTIPTVYVYFAPTITQYETHTPASALAAKAAGAGSSQKRTQTIKLR